MHCKWTTGVHILCAIRFRPNSTEIVTDTPPKEENVWWVPVSSTGKVSDGCIRDLRFNPRLHQNWLVSWSDNKKLLSGADAIGWNSLSKRKKEKKENV